MLTRKNFIAMVIGHAVGDAMGVPVENELRRHLIDNPVVEMRGYGTHNQPPGTWSGDTSLTIAAMESITRLRTIDPEDLMKNFVDWYSGNKFTANDDAFDCDPITAKAIENFLKGYHPNECGMTDYYSNENGALIKLIPIAAYVYITHQHKIDDASMELIHAYTSLTHGHPCALIACGIYCLIAAQIFAGQKLSIAISNGLNRAKKFYSTREFFKEEWIRYEAFFHEDFASTPSKNIVSRVYIIDNLKAALWCLLNTNNYKDLILKAVNLGGDADTVAAIAGGLAGAHYGLEQIPAKWLDVLKKKDYLTQMAINFYDTLVKENK